MHVKFNKKKLENLTDKKESSLLTLISKEERRIKIQEIRDINEMVLTFNAIWKKRSRTTGSG